MVQEVADYRAEGILLAGAGRAILLQLANPAIGRGVAAHSTFTERPVNRLKGTLTYVYAVVYGTDEQVHEVRRRVNRAHAPVRRIPDESSAGYSAFDPALQLWVAATLYDTALTVIEKIYGPLDEAAADAMYRDYARLGTALQVPAAMWPADRDAFGRYWKEQLAALRVEAEGAQVGRGLLYPENTAFWYRAMMPSARFLTAGLLPGQLRKDFGLAWSDRHERRFNLTMRVLAVAYPKLPRGTRHWFKDYCLGELDKDLHGNGRLQQRQGSRA
ncbi:oxygenase MpaB family protein [Pseudarthrobacter sp. lyk4-40-TYG-27]|uniref:oxygenase MpaB family protein n=1 Tax=Pseudarthrobacter sp. lyk4-40-TYG-27 TaxID=3040305 RepID=UPI002557B504|nr:oxygenase MpaB family protein [Pseudarthrobacter sp. lyk4-40-TYG-27]